MRSDTKALLLIFGGAAGLPLLVVMVVIALQLGFDAETPLLLLVALVIPYMLGFLWLVRRSTPALFQQEPPVDAPAERAALTEGDPTSKASGMSRNFRIAVAALLALVGFCLTPLFLVFESEGDSQAALVYGFWGLILLAVSCLVILAVHHPLPWRLVGAATLAATVGYFASGDYSALRSRDKRGAGYLAVAGIFGGYFAIMGRLPFWRKPPLANGTGGENNSQKETP